jgi:hypothetical protein
MPRLMRLLMRCVLISQDKHPLNSESASASDKSFQELLEKAQVALGNDPRESKKRILRKAKGA